MIQFQVGFRSLSAFPGSTSGLLCPCSGYFGNFPIAYDPRSAVTGILIWGGLAFLGIALEVGVLFQLRTDPLRRVRLRPVSRAEWRAGTGSPSTAGSLEAVRRTMTEIRGLLPFFGGKHLELDHPAHYLSKEWIDRLLNGSAAPTVACGTYSQLLAHRLGEEGVPARVVASHMPDFSEGHVVVEAFLSGQGGWILLDPLYDAVFQDPSGQILDAPAVREAVREGSEIAVVQGPAAADHPHTTSDRLLQHLEKGLMEHLVAFPLAPAVHEDQAPWFARGMVLSNGDPPWWTRTRRLQNAAMAIPAGILLASGFLVLRMVL